jgi:hypothetical protein
VRGRGLGAMSWGLGVGGQGVRGKALGATVEGLGVGGEGLWVESKGSGKRVWHLFILLNPVLFTLVVSFAWNCVLGLRL